MSIVTDLQEARELILKEEHWTQKAFARAAEGNIVEPLSPNACQWCAAGALEKVVGLSHAAPYKEWQTMLVRYDEARDHLAHAARYLYDEFSISSVNDNLGHSETIQMFNKAIQYAKGQA